MKRSQYGFGIVESIILVAIIIVVGLLGWVIASQTMRQTQNNHQPQEQTPRYPASDLVTVKLVDKTTNRHIANAAVTLRSDNGTRCITEPCETNPKEIHSKTNANGEFTVSKAYFQQENYVEGVEGFLPVPVAFEVGDSQIVVRMSPGQ